MVGRLDQAHSIHEQTLIVTGPLYANTLISYDAHDHCPTNNSIRRKIGLFKCIPSRNTNYPFGLYCLTLAFRRSINGNQVKLTKRII